MSFLKGFLNTRYSQLIFVSIVFLILPPSSLAQNSPHLCYGKLYYTDGSSPGSVTFSAHILSRAGEVLDQNSFGCGYDIDDGIWFVQCGSFETQWEPSDVLRLVFTDPAGRTGSIEVPLTASAADDAGNTTLTMPAHPVKLLSEDKNVTRGENITVNIHMENWTLADSLVAYELTLGFNNEVLLPLGAESSGTMTRNWDSPAAAPKEMELVIGGFTTNQPDKRLNTENDILVKAAFQVHGIPSTQTSNETLVRILRARLFTLDEEIVLSHSRTGALKVEESARDTTVNIMIYPGWNLISLAIAPEPNLIPDVFSELDISYAYGYRASEGPMSWSREVPDFLNDFKIIDGIHGYWLLSGSQSQQTWTVSGTPISKTTPITLYRGWNLPAYLPEQADSLTHALSSLEESIDFAMGYDEPLPGESREKSWSRDFLGGQFEFLNDLQILKPNMGYWLRMSSINRLVYPSEGYRLAKKNTGFEWYKAQYDSGIIITPWFCDFWNIQSALTQPGDIIEAFARDTILCGRTTVEHDGGFLIHVFGNDLTTEDIIEGAMEGDTITFYRNGQRLEPINNGNIWHNRESKEIQFSTHTSVSENKPLEFATLKNFPNPFNAMTTIQFSIKKNTICDLIIYSLNGRLVKTLYRDQNTAPGMHTVLWDGKDDHGIDAASGTYILQLRGRDNAVVSHKMLFIK